MALAVSIIFMNSAVLGITCQIFLASLAGALDLFMCFPTQQS